MVHGITAPGLAMRPYFNRYIDDAIDLCDVLSAFSSQGKVTLHELCRVMGLPGKPDGISGAEVEKYYRDGHIDQIAEYCESDVVNTCRVWLRYERFRAKLSASEFQASETAQGRHGRSRVASFMASCCFPFTSIRSSRGSEGQQPQRQGLWRQSFECRGYGMHSN